MPSDKSQALLHYPIAIIYLQHHKGLLSVSLRRCVRAYSRISVAWHCTRNVCNAVICTVMKARGGKLSVADAQGEWKRDVEWAGKASG